MPTNYKILGQTDPIANTETLHYSVPSATSAVIKSINITNTSAVADTFSIAIVPIAATAATTSNYIAYNSSIPGNSTVTIKNPYTLNYPSGVRVLSTNGTCTFTTFGTEIS